MGIIASMALMPVCRGSRTGWRSTTPGARRSTNMKVSVVIGPLPSRGCPQRVDDAADHRRARRDLHDPPGPLDHVPLADEVAFAEQDDADVLLLEVQGQAEDAVGELQELVGHDPVEAVDTGDAVADRGDGADLADVDLLGEAFDLLLDDLGDLIGFDAHDNLYSRPSRSWSAASSPSTDTS